MVPDIAECFRLMEEYGMLPNIRRHSLVVARVAWLLVEGFRENGGPPLVLDQELVVPGALLHDIAKTPCLHSGCDHAREGGEICRSLGYPAIAGIVEEHVLLKDHDDERRQQGVFMAREIIYYADKRVRHEEIVSLADRLVYILERYGVGNPEMERRIRENFARCVQLEYALFRFLPFTPEQLSSLAVRHVAGYPAGLLPAEEAGAFVGGTKEDAEAANREYGL
ncbi:MAG TPA: metal-dependent phosphohydrolase [Desulfobulbaceae bacterium]|nr:metal-dependent phosphohydrolase [Desulfobulbaceae bacterium]